MADGTSIEWTDATVNAVNGCSVVSPGCTNCYAMRLAGTRLRNHPSRAGLTIDTKAGPVWNGEVRLNEAALLQPLRWRRPRKIFWNAHGDLFHPAVPDEWIDRQFVVMGIADQHIHQVLTKRPDRMRQYLAGFSWARAVESCRDGRGSSMILNQSIDSLSRLFGLRPAFGRDRVVNEWPLPNVWLGTSVEDQVRADERVPHLLAAPAAVRFLSCEPLLGPVDLTRIHETCDDGLGHSWESCLNGKRFDPWGEGEIEGCPKIDWIIVGGESGPKARPMHPDWARSLRDQCAAAAVPFFFKQWGEWAPTRIPGTSIEILGAPSLTRCGKKAAGRLLDGVEHNGLPEVARG